MPTESTGRVRVHVRSLVCLTLAALCGCRSRPLAEIPFHGWGREWYASILTGDGLSVHTRNVLGLYGLSARQRSAPEQAGERLLETWRLQPDRDILIALAELSLQQANREGSQHDLLLAARYAHAALFDPSIGPPLTSHDPRSGLATSFYDAAVARHVQTVPWPSLRDGQSVTGRTGAVCGVSFSSRLPLPAAAYQAVLPAYSFRTDPLDRRHLRGGIGAPLVAVQPAVPLTDAPAGEPRLFLAGPLAATALLRYDLPFTAPPPSRATLELHDPLLTPTVPLLGRDVPLAADWTAPLALIFSRATNLNNEWINRPRFLDGDAVAGSRGLHLLHPYRRGRTPVVFVHGLLDTSLTWFQMLNDLTADPVLHDAIQPWLFLYPTVSPIPQSAAELRAVLTEARDRFDPGHDDPALDRMVLVGHSMGGVLARLQVSAADAQFAGAARRMATENRLPAEEADRFCQQVGRFEPLPFVRRVIFIGTPHRGSELAAAPVGRMGSAMARMPRYLERELREGGAVRAPERLPNSIDNLRPGSPFMQALAVLPISSNAVLHTIIANTVSTEAAGDDGIVPYASAALPQAASEKVLHAHHLDMHHRPETIQEVRRILRLHCGADQARYAPGGGGGGRTDAP